MSVEIKRKNELEVIVNGHIQYTGRIYKDEARGVLFDVPTYATMTTPEVREILIRMETIEKEGL